MDIHYGKVSAVNKKRSFLPYISPKKLGGFWQGYEYPVDVMLMQSLGPICRTLTYFEGKSTHIDIQTHQILANGRNFDRWKKTDHSLAVVVVSIIF